MSQVASPPDQTAEPKMRTVATGQSSRYYQSHIIGFNNTTLENGNPNHIVANLNLIDD